MMRSTLSYPTVQLRVMGRLVPVWALRWLRVCVERESVHSYTTVSGGLEYSVRESTDRYRLRILGLPTPWTATPWWSAGWGVPGR